MNNDDTTRVNGMSGGRNLGRPSDYDTEEDAIILSTTSTEDCQRLLKAAGKKDRSRAAIISRRKKLREEQEALKGANGDDARAEELFKHRRRLSRQLELNAEERKRLESEIEEVNAQLRDLI